MNRILTVTALLIATLAYAPVADAQEIAPSYEAEPDFGTSIALHVASVSSVIVGTAGLTTAFFGGLGCIFSDCGQVWGGVGVASGIVLTAGIALGIAATIVHADTRSRRGRASLPVMPLVWADPLTGSGGLDLRMQF
jgi:hypothetical protein